MTLSIKALLWFVVLMGLAAVVGAVVMGGIRKDIEVEDKPYEAALRFDEDRDRLSALGWRTAGITLRHTAGEAEVNLTITDRDGRPAIFNQGELEVLATRPAGDLPDVPCSVQIPHAGPGDGSIRALCAPLAFGHWEFIIIIETDKGPIKLVERTYVKKRDH